MATDTHPSTPSTDTAQTDTDPETETAEPEPEPGPGPAYDAHPSWSNYTWAWIFCWLVVPLVRAWWHRRRHRYTVTSDGRLVISRVSLTGISTSTDEYNGWDIERVQTERGGMDRLFGAGAVTLTLRHEHYDGGTETIELPAMPNHDGLADALRRA